MRNRSPSTLVYLLTVLVLLLMMFLGIKRYLATAPFIEEVTGSRIVIYIKSHTGAMEIARSLEEAGVVSSRWLFLAYSLFRGSIDKMRPGEYEFRPDMSLEEILTKLVQGKVIAHQVTIPEGYTLREIARLLAAEGLADEGRFIALSSDPEILTAHGIEGRTLEGYLFPDTYNLTKGVNEEEIIHKMLSRFHQAFGPEELQRARQLRMSVYQVVTLASIIEKEAAVPMERPLISGVFHNRLRRGMPLQADPTVIYGLSRFNGRLSRRDLYSKSSYNTYLQVGLPPGPIANPGKASLQAALYPENTKYLYFVSKNDGTHYFSTSPGEHERAVRRYQLRRGQ